MEIDFLPFNTKDFNSFIAWCNSEEITRQLDSQHLLYPVTHEKLAEEAKNEKLHSFSVYSKKNLIGHAAIRELSSSSAEICRVIIADSSYLGHGLGREIVERLLDIANHNLKKTTVIGHIFEWNTDGIRCYTTAGFKRNPSLDKIQTFDNEKWLNLGFELHFTSI